MKNIFKFLILFMLLSTVACEEKLEDLNIDPNTSPTANEAQVLTSSIGYLGYIQDVYLNRESFLWAEYYTWGIGVSLGNAARYVSQPDDFNNYWFRAYANSLQDLKFLTKSDIATYNGTGKILTAYIYQGLVDHFGDIPYSEALSGEIEDGSILTPKSDEASFIYSELIALVDAGIADLSGPNQEDMGSADLLYGGDISKWIKFGNSLKLRLLMRTSETNADADAIRTLISENNFISTSSDRASIAFDGAAGNQNPMYARNEFGVGDFYFVSNATLNVLDGLNDPRKTAFYSPATTGPNIGEIRGIDQGSVDRDVPFTDPPSDYASSSALAVAVDNPVFLMTEWEVNFLRAEAAVRYNTSDSDNDMFAQAIADNFAFWQVADAMGYVGTLDFSGDMEAKLDMIAVQKWISMNGTQEDEGWIETRRFDRPTSRLFTDGIFQTPPSSVLGDGVFPASWLYPASERALNPNSPAQREITDRLFWDN